jgi:hypothetical protein
MRATIRKQDSTISVILLQDSNFVTGADFSARAKCGSGGKNVAPAELSVVSSRHGQWERSDEAADRHGEMARRRRTYRQTPTPAIKVVLNPEGSAGISYFRYAPKKDRGGGGFVIGNLSKILPEMRLFWQAQFRWVRSADLWA